jgi:O-antigen ligase
MISLCGVLIYISLEFLRPEVLLPGVQEQIMLWVALGTIGVWVIETLLTGRKWRSFPSTRFFVGFLIVGIISACLNYQSLNKLLSSVADQLKLYCIFLIMVQSLDTDRKNKFFVTCLVLLCVCLAAGGVAWTQGYDVPGFSWDKGMRLQYSGIFKDSNDLGQIFAVAWTIIFFHLVNGKGIAKKVGDVILLSVLVWAMLLTQSRGTILAATIGVFLSLRPRLGTVIPGFFALAILAAMNLAGMARMDRLSAGETSAEDRVVAWGQGWYMIRSHPLFGVGPENFTKNHPRAAHSSLVQVGAEAGLLGLFCWIGLLYFPLRQTIVNIWPGAKHAAIATFEEYRIQAGLLVCVVSCLFLSRAYKLPLYLLVALVLTTGQGTTEAEGAEEAGEATFGAWASFKQVAMAQVACMMFWRFMVRHFVDGL